MYLKKCKFDLHDIVTSDFTEFDGDVLRRVTSIRPNGEKWDVGSVVIGCTNKLVVDSEHYTLVTKAPVVFEDADYEII